MKLLIHHKVTIAITGVFIFIGVIYTGVLQTFQAQRIDTVQNKIVLLLNTLIERDRQQLANEIFEKRIRAIKLRLIDMSKVEGIEQIGVYDLEGKLIFSSGNFSQKETLDQNIMKIGNIDPYILTITRDNNSYLNYIKSINAIGERQGYISIYYSLSDIDLERIKSLFLYIILLLTLLLALFFIFQLFLSRVIVSKLEIITDGFRKVEGGEIGKQIVIDSHDELGDMAKAFNKMTSERYRVENDMQQLKNYLQNIINSMPSILVGVDIDGKVTQWNKKASDFTGLTSLEALGSNIDTVYPEIKDEMYLISDAIREKEVKQLGKVVRLRNGFPFYEDITVYPLISNGVKGAVIRIDDISSRVKIEEMMVQNEKMLSVGGLAAGMAHEINNPLAGIIQTAKVLENRLSTNLNIPKNLEAAEKAGTTIEAVTQYMSERKVITMIKSIQDSSIRAAQIIKNMLSFARKSDEKKSNHFVEDLIDQTLELAKTDYNLKKQYDFKEIIIYKNYYDNPILIPCEPVKIQQVLLNIFRNGAQAMHDANTSNPTFSIKTHPVDNNSMICIEIKDNGPGIDKNVLNRIFEPFYTTKSAGSGTGLGLSISYFIITENHSGKMNVESESGKGTKFTITLPTEA